jgi:hypothetical protein
MANIQGFEAPNNLGLQPTETGIDAVEGAARRTEGFFNQKADALTQEGHIASSSIQAVGQQAVDFEDHQQISHGAATFAELQNNLTQQWNATVKNANPNDPSVAAKFREEVVAPAIEQFQSGFTTEKSLSFAEQKSEALRTHFFEKTTADLSTLAGIAVHKNISDSTTAMSNTAMTDPSSVPTLLAGMDHSINAMVDSSPTLTPVDAARAKADISDAAKKAIVQAGAIGAIQKSGNPEATADEWIRKYPDYINGGEAKMLSANARQQIRSQNYDYEINRRREKEIATDKSNAAVDQYLIDVRSQDPKLANDPTAKTILNDRTLLPSAKNNLLNYIDRQLKPETDARTSQQTFVTLLRDMRNPDVDSDAMMQKAWDARLKDAGKPGSMSEHDFNQFRVEVQDRKTPEGAALQQDRGAFFKNYGTAIAGPAYTPAIGDPKVYNAEMDARRVENDLKRKGLDPHLAYDPSSQYFLGKPDRLAKWQSSMQQDLQTRASFSERFGNLPPAQQVAPKTPELPKVGEVREGYKYLGGSPGSAASWAKAQ